MAEDYLKNVAVWELLKNFGKTKKKKKNFGKTKHFSIAVIKNVHL